MTIRFPGLPFVLSALAFGCTATPASPEDARVAVDDPALAPREQLAPEDEVRLAATVINQTNRPSAHIAPLVNGTLRETLESQDGVDVDEGTEPTTKRVGFYLQTTVKPFLYTSSTLTVQVRVSVFRYPDLSLLGEISKNISTYTLSVDPAKEDLLLRTGIAAAGEQFLQTYTD